MMAAMPVTSPSQEVAARLTDDGHVVVTGMMTPDSVQDAHADLDRLLRVTRTGRNSFKGFGTQRVYALFAKTRVFDAAATHPLLLGVLDQVLGDYQLSAPVGICIGPGEKAQALHRDDVIYPVPEPHPPLVVNTMWPLDEFTARTGRPDSYRVATGGSQADSQARVIRSRRLSWHQAHPCSTLAASGMAVVRPDIPTTARRDLEYAAGWLRPQENHCLAVPREVVRGLPERLQELLGYNIYPPFVGYVDGSHRRRVLAD